MIHDYSFFFSIFRRTSSSKILIGIVIFPNSLVNCFNTDTSQFDQFSGAVGMQANGITLGAMVSVVRRHPNT